MLRNLSNLFIALVRLERSLAGRVDDFGGCAESSGDGCVDRDLSLQLVGINLVCRRVTLQATQGSGVALHVKGRRLRHWQRVVGLGLQGGYFVGRDPTLGDGSLPTALRETGKTLAWLSAGCVKRHPLGLCLVHRSSKLLGQALHRVHSHGIAIRGTTRHRHLAQRVPRLIPLPRQPRNDPDSSIMLIQRGGELLARARQLLLEVVRLKRQSVPFVLECGEQRGDRGQRRGSRSHDARGLQGEEVLWGELVVGSGLGSVLFDVLLDEALLEDDACDAGQSLNDLTVSAWVGLTRLL